MYSPKIKKDFIPVLYNLKLLTHKPMTVLVNTAIEKYLKEEGDKIYQNLKKEGDSNGESRNSKCIASC